MSETFLWQVVQFGCCCSVDKSAETLAELDRLRLAGLTFHISIAILSVLLQQWLLTATRMSVLRACLQSGLLSLTLLLAALLSRLPRRPLRRRMTSPLNLHTRCPWLLAEIAASVSVSCEELPSTTRKARSSSLVRCLLCVCPNH